MSNTTTTAEAAIRPITFRIPKPGESDPHFGFGRGYYYRGEKLGYWRLIRVVEPGRTRGLTLIRYAEIEAFVSKKMEEAE
jgi:hypothetical protein